MWLQTVYFSKYTNGNAAGGIRTRDLQISQVMAFRYAQNPMSLAP